MNSAQPHSSGLGSCTKPDGAAAGDDWKWIVADDLARAIDAELDRGSRITAQSAEFVGDLHGHAGRVGAVSEERRVVGGDQELPVGAAVRIAFLDDLLPADVALDA